MSQETSWETELAAFLTELSTVQDELMAVLHRKLEFLRAADSAALGDLIPLEQALAERLQGCYERRLELLERAREQGLVAESLTALTETLPSERRRHWRHELDRAAGKSRLLQHHSLTNWVVVQRTLLHLAQLLEIIATGGRRNPTYGKGEPAAAGGVLLDDAA